MKRGDRNVELKFVEDMTFYELKQHVILPATSTRGCSLVELMAIEEQPPDFYCTHYWGEPVLQFYQCLHQHSSDHGLETRKGFCNGDAWGLSPEEMQKAKQYLRYEVHEEPHPLYLGGRSPRYWVCAGANNQMQFSAASQEADIKDSAFFKAMQLSRGMVFTIDTEGTSWCRLWCMYELYESLVDSGIEGYTLDMYTSKQCELRLFSFDQLEWVSEERSAVGLTTGLAAVDLNCFGKAKREDPFPIELIDKGISMKCVEAAVSEPSDRSHIMAAIEENFDPLDNLVHGMAAASVLEKVLKSGNASRTERYLEAVKQGNCSQLKVDLSRSEFDTEEMALQVLGVLNGSTCEDLSLTLSLKLLPNSLVTLFALRSLNLRDCVRLESLPEGLGQLVNLTNLTLLRCARLSTLPSSLGNLSVLTSLNLFRCSRLGQLPKTLGQLSSLTSLDLAWCSTMAMLPDSLGELDSLTSLDLGWCSRLSSLPQDLERLDSLTSLDLAACSHLASLPSSLGNLPTLTSLNLGGCSGLVALPDLSTSAGLQNLDTQSWGLQPGTISAQGIPSELLVGWETIGRRAFTVGSSEPAAAKKTHSVNQNSMPSTAAAPKRATKKHPTKASPRPDPIKEEPGCCRVG